MAGEPGVQRDRNGAGAHGAKEERDKFHPVADQHAHPFAGNDSESREGRGHLIHLSIERSIG